MPFTPTALTAGEEALRQRVRGFLDEERRHGLWEPGLGMAADHSPEFSRRLAARRLVGMTIPKEYGGHASSTVERFVVTEELLAAGAPVGAHWIADRQTAPTLLRFGTEQQRRRFLPRIAAGECYFSIGMSEPDAGSDLAAVRTTAHPTPGGWLVNGTKVWTSMAHRNHYFAVLCRTSREDDRHEGLSQLIVDLTADGVRVSPIPLLGGQHHFNEVSLTDVFVPDDMVLGDIGAGWRQVTAELTFERSGPDRFLSTYLVLERFLAEHGPSPDDPVVAGAVGRLAAGFRAIRQMSLSVARALDRGEAVATEGAMVKDLGTRFEQEVVEVIRDLVDGGITVDSPSRFERLLAEAVLTAPSYTIRGGTTEILRSIIARGLR